MNKKLESIIKLKDLQRELELSSKVFDELINEKEKLMDILETTTSLSEGSDILDSLQIVECNMDSVAWRINDTARHLTIYMTDLRFDKELVREIKNCKSLSNETQYRLCEELVKTFELYGEQYEIQKRLVSKNLKNVLFSDILNVIIEV